MQQNPIKTIHNYGNFYHNSAESAGKISQQQQLTLPLDTPQNPVPKLFKKCHKPQISSIPGTSPKQRDRYRVVCGDEILGDRLAIDQALSLAKRGKS